MCFCSTFHHTETDSLAPLLSTELRQTSLTDQEVEEGEVGEGVRGHLGLHLVEHPERVDGRLEVLLAQVHDGLVDLQITGQVGVLRILQSLQTPAARSHSDTGLMKIAPRSTAAVREPISSD